MLKGMSSVEQQISILDELNARFYQEAITIIGQNDSGNLSQHLEGQS